MAGKARRTKPVKRVGEALSSPLPVAPDEIKPLIKRGTKMDIRRKVVRHIETAAPRSLELERTLCWENISNLATHLDAAYTALARFVDSETGEPVVPEGMDMETAARCRNSAVIYLETVNDLALKWTRLSQDVQNSQIKNTLALNQAIFIDQIPALIDLIFDAVKTAALASVRTQSERDALLARLADELKRRVSIEPRGKVQR